MPALDIFEGEPQEYGETTSQDQTSPLCHLPIRSAYGKGLKMYCNKRNMTELRLAILIFRISLRSMRKRTRIHWCLPARRLGEMR
jgi:hypothetical protein